jgi:hypothetical protein
LQSDTPSWKSFHDWNLPLLFRQRDWNLTLLRTQLALLKPAAPLETVNVLETCHSFRAGCNDCNLFIFLR